jgi:diguanylate cyclase (GGDEF)-like protein/PAS domain S-box-containing protein
MPYKLSILLSSFALASVFAVFGWNLYGQVDKYFETELAGNSSRLHYAYTAQNEALARRAQILAYSIAANTEIQHLLNEATETVHSEHEHDSERVARARHALQEQVKRQWNELHTRYEVQHLQFLFSDGTSFLRMDAPDHFGDDHTAARPMLADIVQDHDSRGGFEIEHTYVGILGVVMVRHAMPDGNERHVGIVEIGFDMNKLLNNLDKQIGTGIALLLDSRRVSGIVLERHRPAMETRQRFILAASRSEAENWLEAGLLPTDGDAPQNRLLTWKERNFHLISFALDDYQSLSDPQLKPPPGTVLIWRDITDRVELLKKDRTAAVVNTMVAWIFAQFFLLVLLYILRREWKRQLKQDTATIENLLQHNALLLNTAANGIFGVNNDGCITFINRAALIMHGFQLEEVMGKNPHEFFYHHDSDGRSNPIKACLFMQTLEDDKPREAEEWLFRRDGSCFPAKMAVTPIFENGQKNGAVIVFHDITEQRHRQEALLQLATTDSLTGASNRRHFLDQLNAELARQRRHGGQVSLLMTDLDFFKHINDEYGHATGDAVLSHFVHVVRQTMRRSDIIGRMGGEEFAILLPGDGTSGARELAERLRRTFESNPAKVDNMEITCTVSIGISDLCTEDINADAPLRRADEALYVAKAAGRNCIELYDPTWQQTLRDPENTNAAENKNASLTNEDGHAQSVGTDGNKHEH